MTIDELKNFTSRGFKPHELLNAVACAPLAEQSAADLLVFGVVSEFGKHHWQWL